MTAMDQTEKRTRGPGGGDWLLRPLPFACAIVAVCLAISSLSVFWGHRQYERGRRNALASDQITVRLLAGVIEEHQKAVIGVLKSYAERYPFVTAVKDKNVDEVTRYLSKLKKNHKIDLTFVTDTKGVLWANFPRFPEALGKDLSYRDWYQGVSAHWSPYISGVFRLIVAGRPLASAIAVPVFAKARNVVGILASSQRLRFISNFVKFVPLEPHMTLSVVDGHGRVLFSNNHSGYENREADYPLYAAVRRARRESRREVETTASGGHLETTYLNIAPVDTTDWTVVAERTRRDIFQSQMEDLRVIGIFSALICLFIVFLLFYFRKAALLKRTAEILAIERALLEAEKRYRALVNASSQVIYRMNGDWSEMRELEGESYFAAMEGPNRDWLREYVHPDDRETVMDRVREAVEAGAVFEHEHRVLRRDGTTGWMHSRAVPVHNGTGEIVEWFGAASDITERKQAGEERERLLQEVEEQKSVLQTLIANAPAGIALMRGPAFVHEVINPLFQAISPGKTMLGKACEEVWPEIAEEFLPILESVRRTGEPYQVADGVYRIRREPGAPLEERYFNVVIAKVVDDDAVIGLAIETTEHVYERRQGQESLRESERRYRDLWEKAPVMMVSLDSNAVIAFVSDHFCEKLGYRREEVLGKTPFVYHTAETAEYVRSVLLPRFLETGVLNDVALQLVKANGEVMDVRLSTTAERDGSGAVVRSRSVYIDITLRKRAEEAMRESKSKLEAALSSMIDAVFISDVNGRFIEINEAFATFYRFKNRGECLKTLAEYPKILDVTFEDGTPVPLEMWAVPRALRGETVTNAEYVLRRKDTGESWVGSYSFGPIRDEAGVIVGSVVVGRDITERKRAEARLRVSEERLHLALEAAKAGTWEWDLATGENFWSEELYGLYGLDPRGCEPSYEVWRKTVHPEDRERAEQTVREAANTGTELHAEWRVQTREGGERWVMSRGRPVRNGAGVPVRYVGTVIDITERKLTEMELEKSHREKVALLKEVHHRVKNNLQIVMSLLGLQASATANDQALEILKDTRNRVLSMALLHEVLYRSENLASISLETYIGNLCQKIIASYIGVARRVSVTHRVDAVSLPMDQAVPCGIIINELVSNGVKHAFPEGRGGTVTVEVSVSADRKLLLTVSDDGVGLPPGIEVGKASTLGLQLVSDLARQLGGQVVVDRPAEGGTVFCVIFPLPEDK
jgi:PAS domain S-box-containing protein